MNRYLFTIIAMLALLISCDEDDICIDQATPHLVVKFNQTDPDTQLDSLIIYKETDPGKFDLIYSALYQDSIPVKIALPVVEQSQAKFLIGSRTYDSKKQDLLVVDYDYNLKYISKACGYGVHYLNPKYSITNNIFKSTEILQDEITTETAPHIQLNY